MASPSTSRTLRAHARSLRTAAARHGLQLSDGAAEAFLSQRIHTVAAALGQAACWATTNPGRPVARRRRRRKRRHPRERMGDRDRSGRGRSRGT
jgi:hypothetical protein